MHTGKVLTDWASHLAKDWGAIRARVAAHRVSPLKLDVERQESVVLDEWQVGAPRKLDETRDDDKVVYPIAAGSRAFEVVTAKGAGDQELVAALEAARKAGKGKGKKPAAGRGPLFGL